MSTIRRRASDELLQVRAIVDNIPALIAIHSRSGELEYSSRAALEYRGADMAEMKQSPVRSVHPDDLPALIDAQQRSFDDRPAAGIRAAASARGWRLSVVPDAIRPGE